MPQKHYNLIMCLQSPPCGFSVKAEKAARGQRMLGNSMK